MLPTYRLRLIVYILILVSFLTAIMAYTYTYSRDVLLEEAENSVTNTSLLLNGNIELEEKELQRYTEIVRDDLRIKEYLFMLVKLGTDNEALNSIYQRHYGWLPVKRYIILDTNGRIILGKHHKDLAQALKNNMETSQQGIFYAQLDNALEMITWAPIFYQDTRLGVIALTRGIDHQWLEKHHQFSGGNLFLEKNGVILLSNLPNAKEKLFILKNGHLHINGELYQIRPIILSPKNNHPPHLWYGVSMRSLLATLERHSRIVLLLTLSGACAILWTGLIIIRNFNKPLSELMNITRSVAKGHLPVMKQSENKNEIYMLSNQFAVMLQALREKQEEIDRVHEELEQSAITDSLTQLYNRRYLQDIFPRLLGQAQREHLYLAGMLLDLDHFKRINDRWGHLAGDHCLTHLAQLLRDTSRTNDYVFRIGGEEFFVLSINDTSEASHILAEKIRNALEKQPIAFKDTVITITTSIGIGHADTSMKADEALTNLLHHADQALYQAKSKGRNQVHVYQQRDDNSRSVWDNVS